MQGPELAHTDYLSSALENLPDNKKQYKKTVKMIISFCRHANQKF